MVEETPKFRNFLGDIRDKTVDDLPGLTPACAQHLREKKIETAYCVLQTYFALNEDRTDFLSWLTEMVKEKNKLYAELCYDGIKAYLLRLPSRILADQSILEQCKDAALSQENHALYTQQERQSREHKRSKSTYDPKRNRKLEPSQLIVVNKLSSSASNSNFLANQNEIKSPRSPLDEEVDIRRQICHLQRQLLVLNLERIEERRSKLEMERETILSEMEKLEVAIDKMQI